MEAHKTEKPRLRPINLHVYQRKFNERVRCSNDGALQLERRQLSVLRIDREPFSVEVLSVDAAVYSGHFG